MSKYNWEGLPNWPWAGCLASSIAGPAAHWAACVEQVAHTVADLMRRADREWRVMARDPLFKFYGGVDSPERKATYVRARLVEYGAALLPYKHRPEALAEVLEIVRALETAGRIEDVELLPVQVRALHEIARVSTGMLL